MSLLSFFVFLNVSFLSNSSSRFICRLLLAILRISVNDKFIKDIKIDTIIDIFTDDDDFDDCNSINNI